MGGRGQATEPPRLFSFEWHPYAVDLTVDYLQNRQHSWNCGLNQRWSVPPHY